MSIKRKFKIGDKVRLRKSSEFYYKTGTHYGNPINTNGIISEVIKGDIPHPDDLVLVVAGLNIVVQWNGGEKNWYNTKDLKLKK